MSTTLSRFNLILLKTKKTRRLILAIPKNGVTYVTQHTERNKNAAKHIINNLFYNTGLRIIGCGIWVWRILGFNENFSEPSL